MQLYAAEIRHAFTHKQRLILFEAREDWYESIANQLTGPNEFVYEVREASVAMGLQTNYVALTYTDKSKKKARMRYGRFTKKK